MLAAAALSAYAVVLGLAGPRWWRRQSWPVRAPRAAVLIILGGQLSAVLALVLAGSVLLVPISGVSQGVSGALAACIIRMREAYASPGGALTEAIGAGLAAGVVDDRGLRLSRC